MNRGAKHVIVSISDGRVYQWGEIIISEIEDRRVEPQFVPAISFGGKRVMQVACSQAHTVALTEDGQVYCWGFNKWGQLGNGNRPSEMEPVKISGSSESHEKFVFVACCAFVSFAIDSTGNVSRKWEFVIDYFPHILNCVGVVLGLRYRSTWLPFDNRGPIASKENLRLDQYQKGCEENSTCS